MIIATISAKPIKRTPTLFDDATPLAKINRVLPTIVTLACGWSGRPTVACASARTSSFRSSSFDGRWASSAATALLRRSGTISAIEFPGVVPTRTHSCCVTFLVSVSDGSWSLKATGVCV